MSIETCARRKTIAPSKKYDVACYWQERQHRERPAPKRFFVIDIGEPSCFACGWYSKGWELLPNGTDAHLRRIWRDTRGLEICHLVPWAKGGSDEVGNLVLLCHRCHMAAPDFLNPEYMLRWMSKQTSWLKRELDEMERAAETTFPAFGLRWPPTPQDLEKITQAMAGQGFREFYMDTVVVAPSDSRADRLSTFMAAYCEYEATTLSPTLF